MPPQDTKSGLNKQHPLNPGGRARTDFAQRKVSCAMHLLLVFLFFPFQRGMFLGSVLPLFPQCVWAVGGQIICFFCSWFSRSRGTPSWPGIPGDANTMIIWEFGGPEWGWLYVTFGKRTLIYEEKNGPWWMQLFTITHLLSYCVSTPWLVAQLCDQLGQWHVLKYDSSRGWKCACPAGLPHWHLCRHHAQRPPQGTCCPFNLGPRWKRQVGQNSAQPKGRS